MLVMLTDRHDHRVNILAHSLHAEKIFLHFSEERAFRAFLSSHKGALGILHAYPQHIRTLRHPFNIREQYLPVLQNQGDFNGLDENFGNGLEPAFISLKDHSSHGAESRLKKHEEQRADENQNGKGQFIAKRYPERPASLLALIQQLLFQ